MFTTIRLTNDQDGNDTIDIGGKDYEESLLNAIVRLGYNVSIIDNPLEKIVESAIAKVEGE